MNKKQLFNLLVLGLLLFSTATATIVDGEYDGEYLFDGEYLYDGEYSYDGEYIYVDGFLFYFDGETLHLIDGEFEPYPYDGEYDYWFGDGEYDYWFGDGEYYYYEYSYKDVDYGFEDEDFAQYGDEAPDLQDIAECAGKCIEAYGCLQDGECIAIISDIDMLTSKMQSIESCQYLFEVQAEALQFDDPEKLWEEIFYAQQGCYYDLGSAMRNHAAQNTYWCQGDCITEFIYMYKEEVEYGDGHYDEGPLIIYEEDLDHCKDYCFEIYNCDETCDGELEYHWSQRGPACMHYEHNRRKDGEEWGEGFVTLKTMSSFVGCLHENRPNFYHIPDGEAILDCAIHCYEGFANEFGGHFDDQGEYGEDKDECEDYACYTEIFECNSKCEKINCPQHACLGDSDEFQENMKNNSNCQTVIDTSKSLENPNQVAPLTYTDKQKKCADHLATVYSTNNVGVELFKCYKTCAENAIKKNNAAAQGNSTSTAGSDSSVLSFIYIALAVIVASLI